VPRRSFETQNTEHYSLKNIDVFSQNQEYSSGHTNETEPNLYKELYQYINYESYTFFEPFKGNKVLNTNI
jgi:hypothetical protein